MTLTFVTNFVHHHQLPLADEFYRLLGDEYHYITTDPLPDWLIKGGYDPNLERPYIVRPYLSTETMSLARKLIDESDVVIMGQSPMEWAKKRKSEGMVTFYATERPYKKKLSRKGVIKETLRNFKYYGRYKRTYMLCASAFTASDFALTHCFQGKCFKWGYMTAVDYSIDVDKLIQEANYLDIMPIMWCARFLDWKHPELPVLLASRLKERGYNFQLDMFGSGEEFDKTKKLIEDLQVEDCISLCGNLPNDEILKEMRNHRIFIFTSDRIEGWGAVLNEAMSNGCVPVASDEIGSVPYLVKDGYNGRVFRSCDIYSLEEAVCSLLDNPEVINNMAKNAVATMQTVWSPRVAAENFIDLAQHALNNNLKEYTLSEGPASWDRPC